MRGRSGFFVESRAGMLRFFPWAAWLLLVVGFGVVGMSEPVTLLWEDFEDGLACSATGLWHVTADTGVAGVGDLGPENHAAYYGQDDTAAPNYIEDSWTSGELSFTMPVINTADYDAFELSFDYWRDVEPFGGGQYDQARVEVRLDSGAWLTIWMRSSTSPSIREWVTENSIGAALTDGAKELQLRFVFDSIDDRYNNYVGWLVDDIRVVSASQEDAASLSEVRQSDFPRFPVTERLTIETYPVAGASLATRMICDDEDVEWTVVHIFDSLGNMRRMERSEGNAVLVAHATDRRDMILRAGVYILYANLLSDGEWVKTAPRALIVR